MEMVSDTGAIRKVVEDVLAQNEKAVNEYKGGKAASFNFLIGQCMRALRGKAFAGRDGARHRAVPGGRSLFCLAG